MTTVMQPGTTIPHPHDITLPRFAKSTEATTSPNQAPESPQAIASQWLTAFSAILASNSTSQLPSVIHEEGWWRDQLALTWDFRTCQGLSKITNELFPHHIRKAHLHNFQIVPEGKFVPHKIEPLPDLEWVEFMVTFANDVGTGKGMIRLACCPTTHVWKAHMIYTALQTLDAYPEHIGPLRPHGGTNSLKGGVIEGNWLERRERQVQFLDEEPTVLIIGAGQSGLNLGARLGAMGVSALIIDRNERIGDNWRKRYRTLVTHDPVQFTHMAYMPFPANWPLFTAKDKLADWFEIYASAMELNVWLQSTIGKAEFVEDAQEWVVDVVRGDGTVRTLRPRHVVMCSGHAGEPRIPTFPGQDTFKGVVYHGSQHKDATTQENVAGKKVVVVGTGNSGHDMAQNYCENGASVTMLQRRGTYVIQASKGLEMVHAGMYDDHGPPTEDADIAWQSLPIPVQFVLSAGLTEKIKSVEKENIEGLTKAGFKVDFGHDNSGMHRKYITRGGGYYIDVGCSQLIVNGKIKVVQSPDGIKGFTERSLVLADGRELEADIVVLATGYDNMRTTARKTLGDKVADRCKDVWDLDEEGEVNAV